MTLIIYSKSGNEISLPLPFINQFGKIMLDGEIWYYLKIKKSEKVEKKRKRDLENRKEGRRTRRRRKRRKKR